MSASPRLPFILPIPARQNAILKGSRPTDRNPITRFQKQINGAHKNPIWFLVHLLCRPANRLMLSAALAHAQIPSTEYLSWKNVVLAKNFSRALDNIFLRRGLTAHEAFPTQNPVLPRDIGKASPDVHFAIPSVAEWALPEWLVLHLVCNRVKSVHCATALASFLLWQTPHLGSDLLRPMSILTTCQLALWSLEVSLGTAIQTFIYDSSYIHSSLYFNLLLEALAFFPRESSLVPRYISIILDIMTERQLTLYSTTYGAHLSSKFLTLELVQKFEARMAREMHQPTQRQLDSLLHFYTLHGMPRDAARVLQLIRNLRSEGPGAVPHTGGNDSGPGLLSQVTRHNTIHLKSIQKDVASSSAHIKAYLESCSSSIPGKQSLSDRLHKVRALRVYNRNMRSSKVDETLLLSTFFMYAKKSHVSSEKILCMLKRLQCIENISRHRRRYLYTAAIAALMRRRDYGVARSLFETYFTKYHHHLDSRLIRLGVMVETLSGNPREGFQLLFTSHPSFGRARLRAHISPFDIRFFNGYISALHRIGRDDLIFVLWEKMGSELALLPDGHTLSILLNSARRISCGPLRSSNRLTTTWRNIPAWCAAREVFRSMLFNSYPNFRSAASGINPFFRFATSNITTCTYPFPVSQIAFKAYIHLLASASHGEEIPEAIEWMYRLQVKFTCEIIALATVGWEEHNSSSRGVMGSAGQGKRFLERLRLSGIETQDRWPTEHDLWMTRKQLYYEKHPLQKE